MAALVGLVAAIAEGEVSSESCIALGSGKPPDNDHVAGTGHACLVGLDRRERPNKGPTVPPVGAGFSCQITRRNGDRRGFQRIRKSHSAYYGINLGFSVRGRLCG